MSAAVLQQGSVTPDSVTPPLRPFVLPKGHVPKVLCARKPDETGGISPGYAHDLCNPNLPVCQTCARFEDCQKQ